MKYFIAICAFILADMAFYFSTPKEIRRQPFALLPGGGIAVFFFGTRPDKELCVLLQYVHDEGAK